MCYAGSWLKTSEWLYNLTRISSAMHNSQEAIDVLMTYREFCTNVQNQQLARDSFGNFHQRLNKNDAVITVWDSGKFIQLILNEQRDVLPLSYTIHDELNLEWKSNPTFRPSRQLLIVEGLKQYNANRDKVLKNALKHHITSKNVSADGKALKYSYLHTTDKLRSIFVSIPYVAEVCLKILAVYFWKYLYWKKYTYPKIFVKSITDTWASFQYMHNIALVICFLSLVLIIRKKYRY